MTNARGDHMLKVMARFGGSAGNENARRMFEQIRWPNGPVCPRCGATDPYVLKARATSTKPCRAGLYKCRAKACRRQYTVTVGSIMEDSHIPLGTWAVAFHLMSSSKKGIAAHWIHRNLGLSYKSAWFMLHRIRFAMSRPPLVGKLRGIVEADETYVGGKPRAYEKARTGRPGATSKKVPVFSVVARGGDVRSFPVWTGEVTGNNLKAVIREHVDPTARIMTDELNAYVGLGGEFKSHERVQHRSKEYVSGDVHVNTLEGYFSLLKRGIVGVYHHVGRQHLDKYLAEFDFRYNARKIDDGERTTLAIQSAEGRRLMYREPISTTR